MGNLLPAQSSPPPIASPYPYAERIPSKLDDSRWLTYTLHNEMERQFDRRSLQFQVMSEFLRNQDLEQMRERFGNSARRRVERSVTRTVARYLETSPIGQTLKDEPWKERLFSIAKDAVTEETQTIDSPIGEDDPHVDPDFDSAVVRKPAWKDNVNFFLRPFSMHPNAGVGLKLNGVRAQVKVYHDDVKFSAVVPITENWNFYSSARLKKFSMQEASLNCGFQHSLRFAANGPEVGVVQYGLSLRNYSLLDNGRSYDKFAPRVFFAFAMDF